MKKYKLLIVVLFLTIGTLLGVLSMATPFVKDNTSVKFSAERAKLHIKEIAKEPHDVTKPEALKKVRDYIIGEISELGLTSEVHHYTTVDTKYNFGQIDVNNIVTTIEGKNDSYIMIVAHYDSSSKKRSGEETGSYGAADDGYGIATMLEIAQVILSQEQELENGIKLLFTDAEEIGLHGAALEVKENPELFSNVGFLINLEARGIKGPAIMFETSNNNKKVIDFYKKATLPVGYSLAGDVYRQMPNGTDFTKFINAGIDGINFAVLNSLDYYHTPRDNYDNISLTSLQHYGEQVLPLVEEYVYNAEYSDVNYFNTTGNSVYFPLLPNVFITYTVMVGYLFMVVLFIVFGLTLFFIRKKASYNIRKMIISFGLFLGTTILALFSGLGVTKLISIMTGIKFSLTYMPKVPLSFVIFLVMLLIELALFLLMTKKLATDQIDLNSMYLGAGLFNILLLLIFMFVLPGGSYLFMWTSLLALVVFWLQHQFKLPNWVYGINLTVAALLYVPVFYLLYLALTIGALPIILLFAVFPLTIVSVSSMMIIKKVILY